MRDGKVTAAPDYTNAAIVMIGVNLFWIFFVIWVISGLVPVLVLAALINHGIDRISRRTGPRHG